MSDAATEGHCVALSNSSHALVWPAEQPRCPASPVAVTCELQLTTKKTFKSFSGHLSHLHSGTEASHRCRTKTQKLVSIKSAASLCSNEKMAVIEVKLPIMAILAEFDGQST